MARGRNEENEGSEEVNDKDPKNETVENSSDGTDPKEEKEGTDIIKKITVDEFIENERISPWAAKVFTKTLDKNEYSEAELKKLYKEFIEEGKKEKKDKKEVRK